MEDSAVEKLSGSVGDRCAMLESTKVNVSKLLYQIRRYQEKVKKHIDDNYINFQYNRTSADLYLEKGEILLCEAEHLLKIPESFGKANDDLLACLKELQEVSLELKVSLKTLQIDDLFQCIEESNDTKDYLVAVDYLGKLRSLIFCDSGDEVEREFQKYACFDTIMVKYHIQTHVLQQKLKQRFEQLVRFSEKSHLNTKFVTLQISKDVVQLQNISLALFQARYNPTEVCHFLLKNFLEPLVLKPVSLDLNDYNSDFVKLTLSYTLKELENGMRPSYKQVFEHIQKLVNVLASLNVSISPEQHIFTIIGDCIKDDFLRLFVDECLVNAIPETVDEMEQSTLAADVLTFEQMLADTDFIDIEKDRILFKFTEEFETYFQNRFFGKALESAKEFMQRSQQDMTIVSGDMTSKDFEMNPFIFQNCAVSTSTLELVKLLERLFKEPDGKYLRIIPDIINEYVVEMPRLHKLLEPQQSALFYNNCIYLLCWLKRNTGESIDVRDALLITLQAIGSKYLNAQIDRQQKILNEFLKELNLSVAHTLGQGQLLKIIEQCLSQLKLLKNEWENVLPDALYSSTLCDLSHNFCTDIIERILAMDHISAAMGNKLSKVIELILEKVPAIFKEKHDVLQIKSWLKLQQLKTILKASLLEITNQWCEGDDVLTANYKAEEMRHLIKALFPNSYRRAVALSII